jgi:hypothetical protein
MHKNQLIRDLRRENRELKERIAKYEDATKSAEELRKAAAAFDAGDYGICSEDILKQIVECVVSEAIKDKKPGESVVHSLQRVDNDVIVDHLKDDFIETMTKHDQKEKKT